MKEKVVAFVPIKLNNQRLPGKNLMELKGMPLCSYLFNTLKQVDSIDEKYVYCSDDKIQNYIPEGINYLKRSSYLDGFQVKGLEIIDYFVRDVDADIYILTHVTQPFTQAASINYALEKVLNEGYDSAFSCVEMRDYCWYQGQPMNYDLKDVVTTQQLEPVYIESGAFFIFRKEVFTKLHQRIGNKPFMCTINQFEAIDIDTKEDFDLAQIAAQYLSNHEFNSEAKVID